MTRTLRVTPAMPQTRGIEPEPAPPQAAPPPPAPAIEAPLPDKDARAARSQKRHATNIRVGQMLAERFPAIFSRPRPLAVGILRQIRAAVPREELRSRDLGAFLTGWTKRPAYRAALERGERRVNLDGSDAGPAFDEGRADEV